MYAHLERYRYFIESSSIFADGFRGTFLGDPALFLEEVN